MRVKRIAAICLMCVAFLPALGLPYHVLANDGLTATIVQVQDHDFPQIVLVVSVLDGSGQPVRGLRQENFEVFEDNVPANLVSVEDVVDADVGIAVAMAIDVSGSMEGEPLAAAKEAAISFIESLADADQAAVLAFADTVQTVQDFIDDKELLVEAVAGLAAEGNTALYDAAFQVVNMAAKATSPRRVAVLLSDGQEYGGVSLTSPSDALRKAEEEGIPLFTIGLGSEADRAYLEELATLTGGRAFEAPSPDQLAQLYINLGDVLRSQYVLTVQSEAPADGNKHALQIQIKHRGRQVEAAGTFSSRIIPPQIQLPGLQDGQTVNETLRLVPEIDSQGPVARVEYYLGGILVGSESEPPYAFLVDPMDLAPEQHTLKVVVMDRAGNLGEREISFVVASLAPSIQLPALQDGQRVDKTLRLVPEIESQGAVAQVEYYLDGVLAMSASEPPYAFVLDPMGLAPEQHTLKAAVQDSAGNLGENELSFFVAATAPSIELPNLAEGETLAEVTALKPEMRSQTPVVRVEYYIDQDLKHVAEEPPFRYVLDPEAFERGSHILTVAAYDAAGSTGQLEVTFRLAGVALNLGYLILVVALALALFAAFAVMRLRRRLWPSHKRKTDSYRGSEAREKILQ